MKKVAVVGVASSSGEQGGAENLFKGLSEALSAQGVDVDLLLEVSDESCMDNIKESYLKFYDLNLSLYDGVISTKAPSYIVQHPNHVCYLVHTMRVFYDMFDQEFPHADDNLIRDRAFIQQLDTAAFKAPGMKKIFTIGWEVTNRLKQYNGVDSDVLHPALLNDHFKQGEMGHYLFIPGRLHRWKRLDLLIEAMNYVTDREIRLYIAGCGEAQEHLKNMANSNPNIIFLGRVLDEELVSLYAGAFAVPFVTKREDYGYITLEAFKSGKPVITCEDSGEPAWFVRQSGGGIVCSAAPKLIAKAIGQLCANRMMAVEMGKKGLNSIKNISWKYVASMLLKALFDESSHP